MDGMKHGVGRALGSSETRHYSICPFVFVEHPSPDLVLFCCSNKAPLFWEDFPPDLGAWLWECAHSATRALERSDVQSV